jgi:uncharacterized protein YbjQ (UPF0145 family)
VDYSGRGVYLRGNGRGNANFPRYSARSDSNRIDRAVFADETGGMNAIIVTTTNSVEGRQITQYLGIVRGIAVRVPTIGQGFQAIGNVLSGNMQAGADMYADLCETARAQAYSRLVEHAQQMGADAVIAMRFTSTTVAESAAEILAYGTAVKLGK